MQQKLRHIISDDANIRYQDENSQKGLTKSFSLPGLLAKKLSSGVLFRPGYKANRQSGNFKLDS